MAKLFNRAKVNTATAGTGTMTLGAAVSNAFCTFAEAGVANSDVVAYVIEDGTNFEIGIGTYTSAGTTLSRDTVRLSKIGGTSGTTKLTLSGSAVVYLCPAKEDLISRSDPLSWTLQTSKTIGNGNPLGLTESISASGVIGMPSNGWVGRVNLSGDGSFGSTKTYEVNKVTYDLTATSGIFYNPANVPMLNDSERYFYVNNFALVSDNQLVLNGTFSSCTPTVVAQAVTAVTVSPSLTGYSASQTVGWTAYLSGSIYAQGTVTATAGGVIDTTQFASATGLPTAAIFTSTPLILVQKPNATNNNAVLDVGPQLKLTRLTSGVYPAAGSYLGEIVFEGTTGTGSTITGVGTYAGIFAEVVDPTFGTSSATLHFAIGNANAAKAKLTPAAWTPGSNDLIALGTATVSWSDLWLANGAVISWNNSDCVISHGTNTLAFTGGGLGYQFDSLIIPTANDGAPIGSASAQWSDLFLAEGGVINWDNGDVTVTQSGNSLTVAGGNLIAEGTATNDNAATGQIGEFLSSTTTNMTATVTISNASPGIVTWASHGLNIGSAVNFTTTGGLPTGLSVGTTYYVSSQNFAAGSFAVSTTVANAIAGTSINTSSAGSGVHTGISTTLLTSGASADVTGISLTAGDWDVTGIIHLLGNAATTFTNGFACISGTSATLSNTAANATQIWGNGNALFSSATYVSMPPITRRISIAVTTTFFLVAMPVFGTNTCAAIGYIQARRAR